MTSTLPNPPDPLAHAVAELVRHDELHAVDKVLGKYLCAMPAAEWGGKFREAAFRMVGKYAMRLRMYGVRAWEIKEAQTSNIEHRTSNIEPQRFVGANESNFIIRFPFDQQLVGSVRLLPGAKFTTPVWHLPATLAAGELVAEFARLHGFAIGAEFFERLSGLADQAAETAEASRAEAGRYHVEGLKKELRPYQQAGVRYCVEHAAGRAFLCDEMGLGKTAQALAVVQAKRAYPCLVVCPAILKYNWRNEARAWLKVGSDRFEDTGAAIWPEDLPEEKPKQGRKLARDGITRQDHLRTVCAGERIVVVNYEMLPKLLPELKACKFQSVIFDEVHNLRNPKAQRTLAAKALVRGSAARPGGIPVRLGLTGTPVVNGIADLISQLGVIGRLNDIGGFWHFAERYCGAKKAKHGWDLTGRTNAKELHERLRGCCFIRRRKKEVLAELPPKVRATVPIEIDNREEYEQARADVVQWLLDRRGARAGLVNPEEEENLRECEELLKFEALKQIAARGKLAAAKAWIGNFLESGEKLGVFGIHTEIIEAIAAEFKCPKIDGDTPMKKRQAIVEDFQRNPDSKLLVMNVKAAGVGITLTAASNCAFLEQGWTPAEMDQAEDRFHRFGQKRSVTCFYLMGRDTIDWPIHRIIEKKRRTVNAAVEGAGEEQIDLQAMMRELAEGLRI